LKGAPPPGAGQPCAKTPSLQQAPVERGLGLRVTARLGLRMLGGWVNPHREQQTIPQGQTSIPPKSFSTPTAKSRHDPAALGLGLPLTAGSHGPSTASESFSLTALAQHISHSHSGIDEKRPTEHFV